MRYKLLHGGTSTNSIVKTSSEDDLLPAPLNLSRQATSKLSQTGSGVSAARIRIVDEVYDMLLRPRKGIEIVPDENDPFIIKVKFKDFPTSSRLAKSLREHQIKYDSSNCLELRVRFENDYPLRPPQICLSSPILKNGMPLSLSLSLSLSLFTPTIIHVPPQSQSQNTHTHTGTGGVDNGLLLLPMSFPSNWNRNTKLCDLLKEARNHLICNKGEINLNTNCTYDEKAFESVYNRVVTRPAIMRGVVSYLDRNYQVLSESDYRAMKRHAPSLEHGNKVLLPGDDFANFQRRAQQRGDDHFIGDNAMTFELEVLDGPLKGTKSYCGVLQWSAPRDTIVVPDSMIMSLGGYGASKRVRVRHSALPQVNRVTLMPHDPDVLREINESGIGTRAFLELAVSGNVNSGGGRGYTTLQIGQNVSLKAGKHVVEATVTSLKPNVCDISFSTTIITTTITHTHTQVPAVTLWSDYSAEMPLEFREARNRVVVDSTKEEEEKKVEEDEEKKEEEHNMEKRNVVIKKCVKNFDRKNSVKVTIGGRLVIRANRDTSMSEIYDMVARFGNIKDPSFRLMRGTQDVRRSSSVKTYLNARKRHLRLDLSQRSSTEEKKEEEEKEEKKTTDIILNGVNLGKPTARIRVALRFRESSSPKEIVMNLSQRVEILEQYVSTVSILHTHGLSFCLKLGEKILTSKQSLQDQGVEDGSLICEVVEPVRKCDVCMRGGGGKSPVRTYIVNWKCLGLCENHRCRWLERLIQDGDYGERDMKMLTKALVTGNLKSASLM